MFEGFGHPLGARTRFCAVLGHPVGHSASPAMQNAALASLGVEWRYLAFEVRPEELRAAIDGARAMRFIGLNLTVPHKLLALEMVDALDETAKTWGAVNTIRFEGRDASGTWQPLGRFAEPVTGEVRSHGFNTDAYGLEQSLREDLGMELAGAKVVLLGAGGAGRMAALKLASAGVAELFLVNRTASKAEELSREIGKRFPAVKARAGYADKRVDLLINATSLGLKANDASPLDQSRFSVGLARRVYDMIYRPAETPLLKSAQTAGCGVANGVGMLLHQGAKALELWTGQPAPVKVMREALLKNIYGS